METKTQENIEKTAAPNKPVEDRRMRLVERMMRLHGNEPHALIEALHTVQEAYGYLDTDSMRYVSQTLRVPLSKVYGVASFYHFFSLKPAGEHTCVVCTGTACYIGGASGILDGISNTYNVKAGETTADGKLSLLTARCLGSCGLAPAAVFDGEVVGRQSPPAVLEHIGRWMENAS